MNSQNRLECASLAQQFARQHPHSGTPLDVPVPQKGARLNHLYEAYKSSPESPDALTDLMREAEDFALRVVYKERIKHGWLRDDHAADIVQAALFKAWKGLDKFDGKSKFSTWLYRVVLSAICDEFRKRHHRYELQPFDWKEYPAKHTENELIADIDFRAQLRRLNPIDCQIAEWFFCFKHSALEIATTLGKDTRRLEAKCSKGERWVQNRIVQIKMQMAATRFGPAHVTSPNDIERAYLKGDKSYAFRIELEHAMTLQALASLIVPFKPDPNEGAVLMFCGDQRTSGGVGETMKYKLFVD